MTCYDRALPPAPIGLPFYLECETHAVFEKLEKETGDALFICCRYNSSRGNWNSSELETYSENKAEIWFNKLYKENLMESQEETDLEWAEFHATAQEIDVERMLEEWINSDRKRAKVN
jgi:hypothetical protein